MRTPRSTPGLKPGARILLIEDEYLIAAMVEDMLAELGCACVGPIATLDAGLEAARTEPCDAAIINLIIQGEYAYEIATALAARGVPFCFASGVPQTQIAEAWRPRPFMSKPYTLESVRAFLLAVIAEN